MSDTEYDKQIRVAAFDQRLVRVREGMPAALKVDVGRHDCAEVKRPRAGRRSAGPPVAVEERVEQRMKFVRIVRKRCAGKDGRPCRQGKVSFPRFLVCRIEAFVPQVEFPVQRPHQLFRSAAWEEADRKP